MTMSQAGLGWARLDLKRVEWIKLVFQVQWTRMSAGVIREQKQGETGAQEQVTSIISLIGARGLGYP